MKRRRNEIRVYGRRNKRRKTSGEAKVKKPSRRKEGKIQPMTLVSEVNETVRRSKKSMGLGQILRNLKERMKKRKISMPVPTQGNVSNALLSLYRKKIIGRRKGKLGFLYYSKGTLKEETETEVKEDEEDVEDDDNCDDSDKEYDGDYIDVQEEDVQEEEEENRTFRPTVSIRPKSKTIQRSKPKSCKVKIILKSTKKSEKKRRSKRVPDNSPERERAKNRGETNLSELIIGTLKSSKRKLSCRDIFKLLRDEYPWVDAKAVNDSARRVCRNNNDLSREKVRGVFHYFLIRKKKKKITKKSNSSLFKKPRNTPKKEETFPSSILVRPPPMPVQINKPSVDDSSSSDDEIISSDEEDEDEEDLEEEEDEDEDEEEEMEQKVTKSEVIQPTRSLGSQEAVMDILRTKKDWKSPQSIKRSIERRIRRGVFAVTDMEFKSNMNSVLQVLLRTQRVKEKSIRVISSRSRSRNLGKRRKELKFLYRIAEPDPIIMPPESSQPLQHQNQVVVPPPPPLPLIEQVQQQQQQPVRMKDPNIEDFPRFQYPFGTSFQNRSPRSGRKARGQGKSGSEREARPPIIRDRTQLGIEVERVTPYSVDGNDPFVRIFMTTKFNVKPEMNFLTSVEFVDENENRFSLNLLENGRKSSWETSDGRRHFFNIYFSSSELETGLIHIEIRLKGKRQGEIEVRKKEGWNFYFRRNDDDDDEKYEEEDSKPSSNVSTPQEEPNEGMNDLPDLTDELLILYPGSGSQRGGNYVDLFIAIGIEEVKKHIIEAFRQNKNRMKVYFGKTEAWIQKIVDIRDFKNLPYYNNLNMMTGKCSRANLVCTVHAPLSQVTGKVDVCVVFDNLRMELISGYEFMTEGNRNLEVIFREFQRDDSNNSIMSMDMMDRGDADGLDHDDDGFGTMMGGQDRDEGAEYFGTVF